MEKAVILGTGCRAAMYYTWLSQIYDIVAFISTTGTYGTIDGICIMDLNGLKELMFDHLIIVVENSEKEKIKEVIVRDYKEYAEICTDIDELVAQIEDDKSYLYFTGTRQIEIINEILAATDDEVADFEWLLNRVKKYGFFCFDNDWIRHENRGIWTVYGLQQLPEEFTHFCNYISRFKVNTAVEIGVYRGRSAFIICAILARRNKDLKYKMVDLRDRIDDYDRFRTVLPQLEKCIPACSDDYKGEVFDFVFIDADHSYDSSINDYNNIGQFSNIITVFHDIYAHEYDCDGGGTVKTWKEVVCRTEDKEHLIFSQIPDVGMGIGCVIS